MMRVKRYDDGCNSEAPENAILPQGLNIAMRPTRTQRLLQSTGPYYVHLTLDGICRAHLSRLGHVY